MRLLLVLFLVFGFYIEEVISYDYTNNDFVHGGKGVYYMIANKYFERTWCLEIESTGNIKCRKNPTKKEADRFRVKK